MVVAPGFGLMFGVERSPWLLKEAFLGLFQIALCKEAYVVDFMHWNYEFILWDVVFSKPLYDWELGSLFIFS